MKHRLLALAALGIGLFLGACSGDSKPNPTPEPTAATVPTQQCPFAVDVCAFAVELEGAARDGSLPGWFRQTEFSASLGRRALDMWAVTGEKPRVTTVGCPGRYAPECSKEFAVALSSLPVGLEEQDGRGIVIFFFDRVAEGKPLLRAMYEPPGGRNLVVAGGQRAFCEPAIVQAGECIEYTFYKFGTGVAEPAAPLEGKLPSIRQVYGATSTVMTLGEPYSIQQGEVWYFKYLCDACGPGPFPNLYRAYRAADGTLVVDDLKAKTLSLGTPVAFTADWQSGTVYLATCGPGVNCYSLESGGADSQKPATVYKSTDGGVTWKLDGEIPPRTALSATGRDEALATTYAGDYSDARYWFYPSGRVFDPPQGVTAKAVPMVLNSLTIVWRSSAGVYYDQAGTALFGPLFDEKYKPQIAVADPQYQHTYLTWAETNFKIGWIAQPYYSYVARIDRDGQMREVFGLPGDTMWIGGEFPRTGDKPPALFGRFRFGTTIDYERDVSFGAVLDLATGKLRRFAELDGARPRGSFVWMEDLVTTPQPERGESRAPFYRVSGAGDCLNIREAPSTSARVLTCLADDVLVGDMGQLQAAGGIQWRLVRTPGYQVGWASTEFLK